MEVCIGEPYAAAATLSKLPIPSKNYADQMQSFADICLKKGDGLSAKIKDRLKDQKVIDAVIESAKSGNRQEV